MEATGKALSYGWVWLAAVLLFFFNTVPLPGGVTLNLLLTPLWGYLLFGWRQPRRAFLVTAALLVGVYATVHVYTGIFASYYVVSTVMILATASMALVAYFVFLRIGEAQLDKIFRYLLMLNFLLTLAALVLLFFPSTRNILWYTISISQDIEPIPRLKLFTPEASHYSYLLAPLVIYFISRMLFFEARSPLITLILVLVPLALSFSLGVMLCLAITGIVTVLVFFGRIFYSRGRKRMLLYTLLALAGLFLFLYIAYPGNPLFQRIANIFENKDTSARGRTYESFILAHKIAGTRSLLFGAGPGQLKLIGRDIVIQYYSYMKVPDVIRIPNACAETIVCYGYLGLALRIALQWLLFFRTRVAANPFRLWLFLFLFIYQFTGSYITNAAEYLLWALVFAPVFPGFIRRSDPAGGGKL